MRNEEHLINCKVANPSLKNGKFFVEFCFGATIPFNKRNINQVKYWKLYIRNLYRQDDNYKDLLADIDTAITFDEILELSAKYSHLNVTLNAYQRSTRNKNKKYTFYVRQDDVTVWYDESGKLQLILNAEGKIIYKPDCDGIEKRKLNNRYAHIRRTYYHKDYNGNRKMYDYYINKGGNR